MRERWRAVSSLWDENKAVATKLDLLAQLDYYRKLSAQLDWQQDPGDRSVRIAYTKSGVPTAALLGDGAAIIDHLLYWVTCTNLQEAHYLLAIINSDVLYRVVEPLMSKGQYGARDLHMHLWKLPIPEFEAGNPLHVEVSQRPERRGCATGAAETVGTATPRTGSGNGHDSPQGTAQVASRVGRRAGSGGCGWEVVGGRGDNLDLGDITALSDP